MMRQKPTSTTITADGTGNDNGPSGEEAEEDEIFVAAANDDEADEHPPVLERQATEEGELLEQEAGESGGEAAGDGQFDNAAEREHAGRDGQEQQQQEQAYQYGLEDPDDYYVDNGVLYQKQPPPPTTASSTSHTQFPPQQQQQAVGPVTQQQQVQAVHPSQEGPPPPPDGSTNICCGLCGTIVPYEQFVSDHLPAFHPEVLIDGVIDLEEVPYETWLNEQQTMAAGGKAEKKYSGGGAGAGSARRKAQHQQQQQLYGGDYLMQRYVPGDQQDQQMFRPMRSTRQLRRISQYRVNPAAMSVPDLELALQKKMVEKMGRKVPVTLVDKLHAKCGICDTVISLNKKFEVVHLVRHFNAWHPTSHKCAGTWPNKELPGPMATTGKPLSAQDFAVIDADPEAAENLQCIWCGMFMSNKAIGMHFHEIHPEEVEVPRCNLCMQEVLINARLTERFGEDFGVTLPDEHTWRSIRFKRDFKSEQALEKAIVNYLKRIGEGADPDLVDIEDLDPEEEAEEGHEEGELPSCRAFQNSRLNCGRRSKPKRQFIMPVVRQAAPVNSRFVEAVTHSHWKCRLCGADIYAAVISAGVIKHYKRAHPMDLPGVQLELCQARLDKISDGNMAMVGECEQDLLEGICRIECLLCDSILPMTPPFNICRAIRHIKMKHPEVMPEHNGGESTRDGFGAKHDEEERRAQLAQQMPSTSTAPKIADGIVPAPALEVEHGVIYATELLDYAVMEMLRNSYGVQFDRVFSVYGHDIDQEIYVLTMAGDQLDSHTVEEIVKVRDPSQNPMVVVLNDRMKRTADAMRKQQAPQLGGVL